MGFLPKNFEIIAGISYLKCPFCAVLSSLSFGGLRWIFTPSDCCLLMTKLRHALENDKITAVILTT